MPGTSVHVRQEHLRSLPALAALLARAPAPAAEAVVAECVQCGFRLTGTELLALAPAAGDSAPPAAPAKIDRLRRGYCARNGCDSSYYRLSFEPRPGIDWERLVPKGDLEVVEAPVEEAPEVARRREEFRAGLRRLALRGGMALGALLLLLLARHWYLGGTIPYLREPEKFEVEVPTAPPAVRP